MVPRCVPILAFMHDEIDIPLENLVESPVHAGSIKNESKIYSATSDGKVPFVSADDIAAVAVKSLTGETPPNTDYVILGPELLSYGEVCFVDPPDSDSMLGSLHLI